MKNELTPYRSISHFTFWQTSNPTPICCIYIKLLQAFSPQRCSEASEFQNSSQPIRYCTVLGKGCMGFDQNEVLISVQKCKQLPSFLKGRDFPLLNPSVTVCRRWTWVNKC